MVKMALDKLAEDGIVELDEEKKAARFCNLCGCAFLRRNPYRKASPTKGGFPRPRWGV